MKIKHSIIQFKSLLRIIWSQKTLHKKKENKIYYKKRGQRQKQKHKSDALIFVHKHQHARMIGDRYIYIYHKIYDSKRAVVSNGFTVAGKSVLSPASE